MDSAAFIDTPHTKRQLFHGLDVEFQRLQTVRLLQRPTLPELPAITEHRELYFRIVVSKFIVDSHKRRERLVRAVQLKFDFGVCRHAHAFVENSTPDGQAAVVEVTIQLRLAPTGRQTEGIEIGQENVNRLNLI